MKRNPIKTLRNKADRLYQEWGKKTYNRCMICRGEYCCLHHYISKGSSSALRYDLENGIPICVSCHVKIHKKSDPWIVSQILKIKGEEWEKRLQKKRLNYTPATQKYYKQIIEDLTKNIEML